MVICPYRLGHYRWRVVAICIVNKGTMISREIEILCPWVIQRTCNLEDYDHNISFSGNLTYAP